MKDWKDYHLFKTIGLNECKVYGKAPTDTFHSVRITSAFQDIFAAPRPLTKYYFTDKIIDEMSNEIGWLKADYREIYSGHKEVGVCLCKKYDLGFVYVINPTYLKIIVVAGTFPSVYTKDSIMGFMIMDIKRGVCQLYHNSLGGLVDHGMTQGYVPTKQTMVLVKQLEKASRIYAKAHPEIDFSKQQYEDPLLEDVPAILNENYNRQTYTIERLNLALSMMMHLKVSEGKPRVHEDAAIKPPRKESIAQLKKRGIVIVDVNWDSELFILNPFGVREHVKYQWYKDENREWQKKVIYIAPFEKKGYHRRSTKELQELKQNPK